MGNQTIIPDGHTFDGWPLKFMTLDNLLEHGDKLGGIIQYVWPHEGHVIKGEWRFHGGTIQDGDTPVPCPAKPLMMDGSSARAFKLVWDQINEKNRRKVREFLESRGLTAWMFDTLIWPNVKFK